MSPLPLQQSHADAQATLVQVDGVDVPARFLAPEEDARLAAEGAGLVDLAPARTLTLHSPDVRRWCNGMFTNNVRKLQPGQGNRHCICDDRGRVGGLLDLYCVTDDEVLIVLDGMSPEAFEARFRMYLILDDIELDYDDTPWTLSLQGPRASEVLLRAGLPVPSGDHDHVTAKLEDESLRIARKDRTGLGGVDLFVSSAGAPAVWESLRRAGASLLGLDGLDLLRVIAGRARWPQDGTDKSMVHELRLDKETCAFDKGCYLGQEVINRIDVRGGVQKRLMGLRFSGSGPAVPGATVTLDDRVVGTVTSLATIGELRLGLGVLRKQTWEPGTAVSVQLDGATWSATTCALPFTSPWEA